MKAYILTTGILFGLLTALHVWRAMVEGAHLATDPWYVLATLATTVLYLWALRLLVHSRRT